ncbi:hypothetical protein LTS15_003444 [Exophiala xenobiotica]|nr:hypothetical protein LTS15_003444 [Exophiala xenobiotica]
MATLVNYDLSTFTKPKPNKRRLQELQHSEARAHAARVAYWRKRQLPPTTAPEQVHFKSKHQDASPDASSASDNASKRSTSRDVQGEAFVQEDPAIGEESKTALIFVNEYSRTFGRESVASSNSESLAICSQQITSSSRSHWQSDSGSDLCSESNGMETRLEVKTISDMRLPRHPKSPLFDPLDTLPVPQDNDVVAAIEQYLHTWAPSQRPGLKNQTRNNPLITDVFHSALQNVELFESMIALITSFKAAGQNFQSRLSNVSLYHKGQALAAIRTKLSSGLVDEAVMLSTVFLMIIDNVFAEYEAYRAHLDGLRRMAKAIPTTVEMHYAGVLRTFVSWAESNALLLFRESVASQSTTTGLCALNHSARPSSKTVAKMIAALPPGFMFISNQLSTQLLSVLGKTVKWTTCIDQGLVDQSDSDEAFLAGFDPRSNNAEAMRLASSHAMLERSISKALFLCHANILNWSCRCAVYKITVLDLAETLRSDMLEKAGYEELWIWLVLVTANAARRGRLESVQSELLEKLVASRDCQWGSIRDVLSKFLLHSKLEKEWKQCWEMAKITEDLRR